MTWHYITYVHTLKHTHTHRSQKMPPKPALGKPVATGGKEVIEVTWIIKTCWAFVHKHINKWSFPKNSMVGSGYILDGISVSEKTPSADILEHRQDIQWQNDHAKQYLADCGVPQQVWFRARWGSPKKKPLSPAAALWGLGDYREIGDFVGLAGLEHYGR